jgi:hypothetical protein
VQQFLIQKKNHRQTGTETASARLTEIQKFLVLDDRPPKMQKIPRKALSACQLESGKQSKKEETESPFGGNKRENKVLEAEI